MPRLPTKEAGSLKKWVLTAVSNRGNLENPLPTTRELGARFRLSNSTAFRVLQALKEEGCLWHAANGRFYAAGARRLLERIPPLVFVLRKVEHWSVVYQAIMEGVSAACAKRNVPVILWSDELLVQHPDTTHPPSFASEGEQAASLSKLLRQLETPVSGVILDHIWSDAVLRRHQQRLPNSILLYRNSKLPGLRTVHLHFEMGAQMALAHLLGRNFEEILPVRPFAGDGGIDQMLAALSKAAVALKIRDRVLPPVSVSTPSQRKALARRLARSGKRVAIVSPEDHIAGLLLDELAAAGVRIPAQAGLLSMQGSKAACERGITATAFNFRQLGARAVEIMLKESDGWSVLNPELKAGKTT